MEGAFIGGFTVGETFRALQLRFTYSSVLLSSKIKILRPSDPLFFGVNISLQDLLLKYLWQPNNQYLQSECIIQGQIDYKTSQMAI